MTEPCAAACEQRSFIYTCALKRRHENTFNAYSNILEEQYLHVKYEIQKTMSCGHPF